MGRIRLLVWLAVLLFPVFLSGAEDVQPVVSRIEWSDLPAAIVEKNPGLKTGYLDAALRSGWETRLNGDPDPSAVAAALSAALRSLRDEGVDPAGYTTRESAADIADLRRLPGIESWNLYGVSYGTKLMLTVLRDHPQGVRSAILDSVLPLEANCDEETPANILDVLDRIFARSDLGSSQGTAWGMRISVWCNEEFPFEKPDKILKPAGMPLELARFIQPQVPLESLQVWPQGQPDPPENEPVRSSVPVLIAAGEFDPDTPLKWGRRTVSFLPNSHLIEFAGYSHVPLYKHPEAARIMREFLADPSLRPDPGTAAVRPAFRLSWDPTSCT